MPLPSSEPKFEIASFADVMIPMRDGVRLAADIHRPADAGGRPVKGAFPALLIRTSYHKGAAMWDELRSFYVPRGYVLVIQDLRSRYRSEGDGRYFHTANPWDGRDGYDTVEWIATQAWCSGKVGTLGSSHLAIEQTLLALERPPHLSAMWPEVGPTNIYAHEAREGGAMALHMYASIFIHALDAHEVAADPEKLRVLVDGMVNTRHWLWQTPFRKGETPLRVAPYLEDVLLNYYTRGDYDEWWARECCNQEPYWDRHADVPIVIAGGWYDPFAAASVDYYTAMAKQNRSPARLIMGPWDHDGMRLVKTHVCEVDFGPDAVWGEPVYGPERLRWFDRWLKGIDTGVEVEPPVRIFVMGGGDGARNETGRINHGGVWRHEREWPITRTRYETHYLRAGETLSPERPDAGEAPFTFTFDPEHPVPTVGGNVTGYLEYMPDDPSNPIPPDLPPGETWLHVADRARSVVRQGPMHQRERPGLVAARPPYPLLADRPDVLAFQSLPLTVDTEVTGAVIVKLWVSSSAIDTDFTVKLVDIYPESDDWPDGFHMRLADTVLRCRYRNSWSRPEMMTPGDVYAITLKLPPVSNLFLKGHRIRLDVSSSNFPRLDLNPNTGEPMGRHTRLQKADNTVYVDRARPSHLVLPVVPHGEERGSGET